MEIYKDCFVVCKVKKYEDGYRLDIPFQVYHLEVFYKGKRMYHQIPEIDGEEVMVHISYNPEEEKSVLGFSGYIGMIDEKDKVMAHPKYTTHWKETEAEAQATVEIDSNGDEIKVLYDGKDKDKLSKCSKSLK